VRGGFAVCSRSPMTGRTFFGAVVVALAVALPATSRGNGAFPDTSAILVPANQPQTIMLGTNFGLVATTDGGTTWRWACEHDESVNGSMYQMAPAPSPRLFTLGAAGLAFSDDLGCAWKVAPGQDETLAYDYFPDPTDPQRVLVIAVVVSGGAIQTVLIESPDGGASFGARLFTAPDGYNLTSIEVARSDPRILFLTVTKSDGTEHTRFARSADRGKTWTMRDPGEVNGHADLKIASIEPDDPQRLFLRVISSTLDGLALSEDGGTSVHMVLEAPGTLQGFIRLHDGSLLASVVDDTTAHLYRSRDHGRTFPEIAVGIHARGFGERAGRVYAATDNLRDSAAIEVSDDAGDSWKPLMALADVSDTIVCPGLRAMCAPLCPPVAVTQNFRSSFCEALTKPPVDAGATPAQPGDKGSGCSLGAPARERGAFAAVGALLLVALARRGRGTR
jgi:photosystem II stability/assembly factor-like uncharacterized protein